MYQRCGKLDEQRLNFACGSCGNVTGTLGSNFGLLCEGAGERKRDWGREFKVVRYSTRWMLRRHSRRDRRLKTCHWHVFLTPRLPPALRATLPHRGRLWVHTSLYFIPVHEYIAFDHAVVQLPLFGGLLAEGALELRVAGKHQRAPALRQTLPNSRYSSSASCFSIRRWP